MEGNQLREFYFHKNVTSPSSGNEMEVKNFERTINIEISSTGTTTVFFEGTSCLGVWRPVMASNMTTLALVTTASDTAPFYQIDTTGLKKIRVRISANTGNTTIVGNVVGQ